jgi:hypothetical protein
MGPPAPLLTGGPCRVRPSPGEETTEYTRLGDHMQFSFRRYERPALSLMSAVQVKSGTGSGAAS